MISPRALSLLLAGLALGGCQHVITPPAAVSNPARAASSAVARTQ